MLLGGWPVMRQNPSLAQFPIQILLFWSSWTPGSMSSLWELELLMEPGRDGSVSSWAGDQTFKALVLRWKRTAALHMLPTEAGTCCWCCFSALGKAQCPHGSRQSLVFPATPPCPFCRANPSEGWQQSVLYLLCWHNLLAVYISTRVHVFTSNEEMGSRKYRWGVSPFMFFLWLYTLD